MTEESGTALHVVPALSAPPTFATRSVGKEAEKRVRITPPHNAGPRRGGHVWSAAKGIVPPRGSTLAGGAPENNA